MAKTKPEFNPLEWFAQHSEAIRDLLWDHLTNVENWEWTTGMHPYWGESNCRETSISTAVGQSGFTIVIKAFGWGRAGRSVNVEIKEKGKWSIGTFYHVCRYGDNLRNARRIVEMTMYFITGEFLSYDQERFYPPKPTKPCPEAELNEGLWIYDEE